MCEVFKHISEMPFYRFDYWETETKNVSDVSSEKQKFISQNMENEPVFSGLTYIQVIGTKILNLTGQIVMFLSAASAFRNAISRSFFRFQTF